jgi:hypothetical protein
MITIEAPWEAQLNWAEDCKRDSYVFDAIDNQISGPVSMDEAVLVSAAPDLLAACEAMYKYDQSALWETYETAIVLVKAAIKKAKGE